MNKRKHNDIGGDEKDTKILKTFLEGHSNIISIISGGSTQPFNNITKTSIRHCISIGNGNCCNDDVLVENNSPIVENVVLLGNNCGNVELKSDSIYITPGLNYLKQSNNILMLGYNTETGEIGPIDKTFVIENLLDRIEKLENRLNTRYSSYIS